MTAILGYKNRLTGKGTWTDVGTAFATSPPLANLGTIQTPAPAAEFTGTGAEFQFEAKDASDAAESFTIRVLVLIGMSIPDGATIEWKESDGTSIATQTWSRFKNRPANSYIVLDADQTVDTIRCEISGIASGTYRIAAAFAGQAWEFDQEAAFNWRGQSAASVTRISGTDWPFADTRRRGIPVQAFGNRGKILGVDRDGNEHTGDDAETVLNSIGRYGQCIVIPSQVSQDTIDALAIYGLLDSVGNPEHVDGDVFRVTFDVLESR